MSYSPCLCPSSHLSPNCMILVSLESEINCRLVLYLEVWEPSVQLIRITVKEFNRHFKSNQQGNEHDR